MTDTRTASSATAPSATGAGWGWIMAYGIVSVLLGITAFAWPFAATFAAVVVIGWLFIIAGGFALAAGIFGRGSESRGYTILLGAVSLFAGLIMVFEPATGALSLTLVVAAWLAARGILALYYGFRRARRRSLSIAIGVIDLLLALFILATVPFSALTLPGYILGLSFLFGGISALIAATDHRRGAPAFAVPA